MKRVSGAELLVFSLAGYYIVYQGVGKVITAMAHYMVSCLIKQNVIVEDDREIDEYGAE